MNKLLFAPFTIGPPTTIAPPFVCVLPLPAPEPAGLQPATVKLVGLFWQTVNERLVAGRMSVGVPPAIAWKPLTEAVGEAGAAFTVTASVVLCGLTQVVLNVWQLKTKLVVVTAVVEIMKAANVVLVPGTATPTPFDTTFPATP